MNKNDMLNDLSDQIYIDSLGILKDESKKRRTEINPVIYKDAEGSWLKYWFNKEGK